MRTGTAVSQVVSYPSFSVMRIVAACGKMKATSGMTMDVLQQDLNMDLPVNSVSCFILLQIRCLKLFLHLSHILNIFTCIV